MKLSTLAIILSILSDFEAQAGPQSSITDFVASAKNSKMSIKEV